MLKAVCVVSTNKMCSTMMEMTVAVVIFFALLICFNVALRTDFSDKR